MLYQEYLLCDVVASNSYVVIFNYYLAYLRAKVMKLFLLTKKVSIF